MRLALLLAGAAMLATPGSAQESASVTQARGAGLIGERFDGYVGFVRSPSESLRRQVNAINIRRRALYSNLARQKGVSAQEVGITATCTLFARIPVGGYYLTSDRGWLRRGAGQAAPRPPYCG
ncbi:MAG: YdbL family protein [Sphingomicrobium sp.]